MDALTILRDGFNRVADDLPASLAGLSSEQLLWQPQPQANHIAWLAWHIGRCEDAQLAALAGQPEVYPDGWAARFGLPYAPAEIGYGHSAEQVRAFRLPEPTLLSDYYRAVHTATERILDELSEDDLDRQVKDSFQVSVGVRLVSVVNDITQHLGQIDYLRGLIAERQF